MTVKFIGSLLVVLAGGVLSFSFCRFEKKKLSVLDSYISLLFYIKGQIDCYSKPISDILKSADREIIEGCGCRFSDSMNLDDMLEEGKIYLERESMRLLSCFSKEFGSTYKDEQLRRCDYYIEALLEERRGLSDDIPSRNKVGSAIWMCASFGLMIVLW